MSAWDRITADSNGQPIGKKNPSPAHLLPEKLTDRSRIPYNQESKHILVPSYQMLSISILWWEYPSQRLLTDFPSRTGKQFLIGSGGTLFPETRLGGLIQLIQEFHVTIMVGFFICREL